MNDESRVKKLRQKRKVFDDISNRLDATTPVSTQKSSRNSKRSRSGSEDGYDTEPVYPPKVSLSASRKSLSLPADRVANHAAAPFYVIKRTLPLHSKSSDPGRCLDIIDKMYNIYYELEDQFSAKPYLSMQKDINQKMRSILVDWLIEVHNKFKLQSQTLWLSVNILDRYLEKEQILRSKLQLVGVSALLIASKHEEIYPPEVKDCVYITDHAYDRDEVVLMETAILTALEYKVSVPTGYHFLSRYLDSIQASTTIRHLASYYAERNLQESDVLCMQPHQFAAASVYAALRQQSGDSLIPVWCRILREESGCTENDIAPCARNIINHVNEEPQTASRRRLVATKNKFATELYLEVSDLPLPFVTT